MTSQGDGGGAAGPAVPLENGQGRDGPLGAHDVISLCSVIYEQVIPELCAAPKAEGRAAKPEPGAPRDGEKVSLPSTAMLETAVVAGDLEGATAALRELSAAGVSVEQIYLDILAPLAMRLGELWESDELDFLAVTTALGTLQNLLHITDEDNRPTVGDRARGRVIAVARLPGDQHIFGVLIVSRLFERAGWKVLGGIEREFDNALLRDIAASPVSVVGISIGSKPFVKKAAALIGTLRAEMKNRRLGILVGGPMITEDPTLTGAVGADAMATDAQSAITLAEKYLSA